MAISPVLLLVLAVLAIIIDTWAGNNWFVTKLKSIGGLTFAFWGLALLAVWIFGMVRGGS